MIDRNTARTTGLLAAGVAAGFLLVSGADALAGPKAAKKGKRGAVVSRLELPLGLQGLRGAGPNVVIPFTLVDPTRKPTDVQAEFGVDINGDGSITDDEYRPASEDRLDPRDTRRNRKPQLFSTSGDIGATHAYAWRTTTDVGTLRFETQLYKYTPQGRLIPDTAHPGEFLFDDAQAGVRVRVRTVRGAGKARRVGEWAYTDAFSVNNNTQPALTIDQVLPNASGTASDEHVEVLWTAIDADSEDKDGDGIFDVGEDANGNRTFDQEQVGVAFDYYRLQPGDNPSAMSDEAMAALTWAPCTRVANEGNTDSFLEADPTKQIFGAPSGRQWRFVWNSVADVGSVNAQFILRARPVDQKKENGDFVYQRSPFTLDNWKVFTSGAAGNADMALSAGRAGCSVTNLVYGLEQSDPQYGKPFQQVVVAGGSTTRNGNGVKNVEVFLVNSETADTVDASKITFTLSTARRYHSATLLSDGRVLFAGGFDDSGNPTATTEIYDPKTRTIGAGPSMNTARGRHTAVLLGTNDVAFIGGVGAGNVNLNSIEIYRFTPAGEATAPITTLPVTLTVPQHSAKALLLPDQKVLITGGVTGAADESGTGSTAAYLLDPLAGPVAAGVPGAVKEKTPSLTVIGSMLEERKYASATPLLDGNVLFAGGFGGGGPKTTLEVFNWKTSQFEGVDTALQAGRSQHVGAMMGDGSVLFAGGATNDPAAAIVTVTGTAEVFRLGTRNPSAGGASTWGGSFLPVNGDMVAARRDAASTVIMSGRPFIVGGIGASGSPIATCEVYTPEGARNAAPKAYVFLPSAFLSHRIGAPIYYRVIDPESDQARVVVQFRHPLEQVWHACTSRPTTFVGDVGQDPAGLTTTATDIDSDELVIDPIANQTGGDHSFIWDMASDIDRPAVGETIPGYTLRVIPYGAVRGPQDVTDPVNVLYNTKVITTLFPLADASGAVNPNQGGDIDITVHIRDIDGPGVGPRVGDPCKVAFYYAIDKVQDGQILTDSGENWELMTPSGAPFAGAVPQTTPQLDPVTSWSEAADSPDSDPVTRPVGKGWHTFTWDALYDLGRPLGPTYTQTNVWIQVIAEDANIGYPAFIRNKGGAFPDEFVYVRDAGALWLQGFKARSSTQTTVKTNEPIDFTFNGNIEPSSVNASTLRIYRGAAQILGAYQVQNDVVITGGVAVPTPGKCTVTFHPQPQNYTTGAAFYTTATVPNTILFPSLEYRINIPAYGTKEDPNVDTPPTLRPLGYGVDPSITATYLLVNSMSVDGETEAAFRFTTAAGQYQDSQPVAYQSATPGEGNTLAGPAATSGFSMTFNHAIDGSTVLGTAAAPNVLVRGNSGQAYVVPGRWTVTNTVNSDGTSSSVLTFVPLMKLPSGDSIVVTTGSGLRGTNGTSATGPAALSYFVTAYGRRTTSVTETFTDATNNDTAYTNATWGTDPCAGGGVLTGSQDGSTQPNPAATTDLIISAGSPVIHTQASLLSDYRDIIVQKGGTLILRNTTGPVTLRANRNVTIDGTLDFSGLDGDGGASSYYVSGYYYAYYYTNTYKATGVRFGGIGYNGGGKGGDSAFSSTDMAAGGNGTQGVTGGGGGGQGGVLQTAFTPRSTSYYYYGVGGGAGGGHARAGLPGGASFTTQTLSTTNPQSTGGLAATFAADFSSGPTTGGGGGGGGGANSLNAYWHTGGAGGAGAGHVSILCNGVFKVSGSGYVNGKGGEGGAKSHYAGAGGGGAGGGFWVKAGGGATLDGLIDLRGGRGGPPGMTYYGDPFHYANATTYGTCRYGGDGAPGRLVIEAPNYLPGKTDSVRVFGAMMIRKISALPTWTTIGQTTPDSIWSSSAGGSINLGGATDYRYANLTVGTSSASVVTLRNRSGQNTNGTPIGNAAAKIWVDGNVTINGTLRLNGNGMVNLPAVGTDYEPFTSTTLSTYFESNDARYFYYSSSPYAFGANNTGVYTSGFSGVLGGGDGGNAGGKGQGAYSGAWCEAFDGNPPTATPTVTTSTGKHKFASNRLAGWTSYGEAADVSGAGGGNASPGRKGWCMYGAYDAGDKYTGYITDTNGTGNSASKVLTDCSTPGGVNDVSAISVSNIGSFAGAGGGGGNMGTYSTGGYYTGLASFGGGGAGAIAILAKGSITVNNGAAIEAKGGDGPGTGVAYIYYGMYSHGAGGGGAGGTVYLVGNTVTIAPATSELVSSGATFDMRGGDGGGWRQHASGTRNAYPQYNTYGNFGGDGGYGRLVIDYVTSLNNGNALVNRYGNESTVALDATNQFRTLAGQATFKCRGVPGGTLFRSKFVDLGSLRPVVNSLVVGTIGPSTGWSLQGQGAQSDPHAVGTGTGAADPNNLGSLVTGVSSGQNYNGWRWWRFQGTISRLISTTQPTLDNIQTGYETDN